MLWNTCGMQNRNRFIFLSKLNILLWSTTQNHKAKLYNNIFICWKATLFSATKQWFKEMMLEGFLLHVLCLLVHFNSTQEIKQLFALHLNMKEKDMYFLCPRSEMKFYNHIISLSKASSKESNKWTTQAFYVSIVYADIRMVWRNIASGLMCWVTQWKNCCLTLGNSSWRSSQYLLASHWLTLDLYFNTSVHPNSSYWDSHPESGDCPQGGRGRLSSL